MVSNRQYAACQGLWLGSDKKTWPTQWWQSGWHFEVMTSKWFRFEEALMSFFFLIRRESKYMWGELLLLSVEGPCV